MLSEQSAVSVRATLPDVGAVLGTITTRFYAGLFAAHPELLNDLFNRGNQAVGTQRQALAGSIAAFATHPLDQPEQRPDAMLHRIAHKHASLGITPEQYDIVHENLFAAIADTPDGEVSNCAPTTRPTPPSCPTRPSTSGTSRGAPAGTRSGLVDLADVPAAPGTRAYLCGPLPFMRAVRAQLIGKGVAPADIHYEVFGPDLWRAGQTA